MLCLVCAGECLVRTVSVASTPTTTHGATAKAPTTTAVSSSATTSKTTTTSATTPETASTTTSETTTTAATPSTVAAVATSGTGGLGRLALVALVSPRKVGVAAIASLALPVAGTSLEVGLLAATPSSTTSAAKSAATSATSTKPSTSAATAASTVVTAGRGRPDHGHLNFDGGAVEVLAVEPLNGAVGGGGVVVRHGGLALLLAGVSVLVDPDLLLAGPLVHLDDADGAEKLSDVVFREVGGEARHVDLIV